MNGRFAYNLTAGAYFSMPGLSASALCHGCKSMKAMRWYMTNETEPSAAMRWGNICHAALLEPDRFEQDFPVFDGPKRGKDWQDFRDANADKEIITAEECEQLLAMIEAVRSRKDAFDLLSDGDHEVSAFWQYEGCGNCKGRMDVLNKNAIVDLKTTSDISKFQNTAAQLLINVRVGWYQVGVREITGALLPVYIVSVEQKPPFDILVYEYDAEALALGRDIAIKTARKYRECEKVSKFPGVCEDIQTLRLPEWATTMQMNRVGAAELEETEADQL